MLALILIVMPLLITLFLNFLLPDPFERTFVGELDEKYDRLINTEGEKIVIVGGSSVAFGIDSEIIEEYTEMPVVNFGLYAALGTKLMLDLSRSGIGSGDIVLITPEISEQTLSLYTNTELTLRAIGSRADIMAKLPTDDKLSLLSGLWDYTAEKLDYYKQSFKSAELGYMSASGVYSALNFNALCDLIDSGEENVMPGYYDTNNMINPTPSVCSEEFIDYLNDYIAFCRERGATVYFNFCPMNEGGFVGGYDATELSELADYLSGALDCDILGSPERSVLGAGYFYDTNFHLNNKGGVKYTVELTKDLLFELDNPKSVSCQVPEEPPLPQFDTYLDRYDENEKYFTFTELSDGSYAISGLTDLGKVADTLVIPTVYEKRRVSMISSGAFSGGRANRLVISSDTSLRTIQDGAFSGAHTLSELWIYYPNEERILPPADFSGVASGFTVHIPDGSNYASGYYWGERGLNFVYDANLPENPIKN